MDTPLSFIWKVQISPIWFGLGYFGCQELKPILYSSDDLRISNKTKVPELRKGQLPGAAGSASHLPFEG